jgi:hypothetical protein
MHGEENGIQTDGGVLLLKNLADKVVKGVEFDSPHSDTFGLQQ